MKKLLPVLMAALTIAVLTGCKDKNSSKAAVQPAAAPVAPEKKVEKFIEKKCLFIYQDASLYKEVEDGIMEWSASADEGDAVTVMFSQNGDLYKKTATRRTSKDEVEMEFIKVVYDETEYWSRAIFVSAPDCTLGIIDEEKAIRYTQPDILKFTENSLKYGTYIAVENFADADFAKAIIYDGTNDFGKEVYLKKTDVCKDSEILIAYKTLNNMMAIEADLEKNGKSLDPVVFGEISDFINQINFDAASDYFLNDIQSKYSELYQKIVK